ncbi:MAG: hypothetical protein JWO32_1735 [Bacteroidetes bacterium]|nr:hypothetical protein [Bacteroidota bacterium]
MKTKYFLNALVITAIIALASCDNRNDDHVIHSDKTDEKMNVNITPDENATITDAQLEQEREEFKHNSDLRIEENKRKIDELNTKIETSDERTRKEYRQRITELKARNEKAKERLNGYKGHDKNKWHEFKREFNHDMDELGHSLKDFTVDNKK